MMQLNSTEALPAVPDDDVEPTQIGYAFLAPADSSVGAKATRLRFGDEATGDAVVLSAGALAHLERASIRFWAELVDDDDVEFVEWR